MLNNLLDRLLATQDVNEREEIVLRLSLDALSQSLQEVVLSAAIPHWFDKPFIAAILQIPVEQTEILFHQLKSLSFIEIYPERGLAIHERTRQRLLSMLWRDDNSRFRHLSSLAASYCLNKIDGSDAWIMEGIYHLLIADPERGADYLRDTGLKWANSPNYWFEKVETLARMAAEHMYANRLSERAQGWTVFWLIRINNLYDRYLDSKKIYNKWYPSKFKDEPLLNAYTTKELGDSLQALSEFLEARAKYEAAIVIYRSINNRLGEARCIRSLGEIHQKKLEIPEARIRYENALKIYQEVDDQQGSADCIRCLGDVHLSLIKPEILEAKCRYEEAKTIYQSIGDQQGNADCLRGLGDTYKAQEKLPEAQAKYEEALNIYHSIGSLFGEANCLKLIGDVYLNLQSHDYKAAKDCYEKALEINRAIGSRWGEAGCLRSLGTLQLDCAELSEAQNRYEEALTIYRSIGSPSGEVRCLQGLASVFDEAGKEEEAEFIRIKFKKLASELGNDLLKSYGNTIWSDFSKSRVNLEQMLMFYTKAIEKYPEDVSNWRNRASALMQMRRLDEARFDLDQAAVIEPDSPRLFLRLGELALLEGRYEESESYFNRTLQEDKDHKIRATHFGLGRLAILRRDMVAAQSAYQQAIGMTDKKIELRDEIDELLRLRTEHPDLHTEIASILKLLHDFKPGQDLDTHSD